MEYVWLGIAALLGLLVGLFLSWRAFQTLLTSKLEDVSLNMASDRDLALRTLRRELANYMVRLDPDRFLRLYRKARAADVEIGNADKKLQEAERTVITQKYPFYQDFDLVATREYVLYADALSGYPFEEVEEHWLSLVKFHAGERVLDKDWRLRSPATSERDLEHLEKYVQQIKDTKFRQRLKAAVDEFRVYRRSNSLADVGKGPVVYETDALVVHQVYHYAEIRYGFHFKDTNEFGLYGFFHDDNNKIYESFYRSDQNFLAENYLDYLHIEEHI